ncbi:MAG: hypothetical protein P1V19_09375 [Gimesia sp.]|nr:hypothetical protein [Gimesia sp.]
METICAEHTLTYGKRSNWPLPGSLGLEDGKNVNKYIHVSLWGGGGVTISKVASLDRFQAQPRWEIPASDDRCAQL